MPKYKAHSICMSSNDRYSLDGEHWESEPVDVATAYESFIALIRDNLLAVMDEVHPGGHSDRARVAEALTTYDDATFRAAFFAAHDGWNVPDGVSATPFVTFPDEFVLAHVEADGYLVVLTAVR